MTTQFMRKAEVVIENPAGGTVLTVKNLRIAFDVSKSSTSETNKSIITIYNLNDTSRFLIDTVGQKLTLKVGYDKTVPQYADVSSDDLLKMLVQGDVSRIEHNFERPEWVTKIYVSEGGTFVKEDKISVSYKKDADVLAILKDIIKKAGLKIEQELADIIKDPKKLVNGFSFTGRTKDALDKLTQMSDLTWENDNGTTVFLSRAADNIKQAIDVNVYTGMIGSPSRLRDSDTQANDASALNGYVVKTLLNPEIRPGALLKVTSVVDALNTERLIVSEVNHTGDTHGNDWMSTAKTALERTL